MSLLMSERDDRARWPATDLGRAWRAPHRLFGDVPACRMNECEGGRKECPHKATCRLLAHVEPADTQPEAASGCYEPPAEPQERADHLLEGYMRGIVSALLVGALVAFVLVVTR